MGAHPMADQSQLKVKLESLAGDVAETAAYLRELGVEVLEGVTPPAEEARPRASAGGTRAGGGAARRASSGAARASTAGGVTPSSPSTPNSRRYAAVSATSPARDSNISFNCD